MQGRSILPPLASAVALALAAAASAEPAPTSHLEGDNVLVLAAGERVTLRLAETGKLQIDSVAPAQVYDAAPPSAGGRKLGPNDPLITAPSGTITLVLSQVGDAAWLKIENGTSLAFDYQAWMPKADGLEPTSVCTVLPLLAGYEQWPGRRLPRLVLNRFTPRATNSVDCPQPTGPPPAVPGL